MKQRAAGGPINWAKVRSETGAGILGGMVAGATGTWIGGGFKLMLGPVISGTIAGSVGGAAGGLTSQCANLCSGEEALQGTIVGGVFGGFIGAGAGGSVSSAPASSTRTAAVQWMNNPNSIGALAAEAGQLTQEVVVSATEEAINQGVDSVQAGVPQTYLGVLLGQYYTCPGDGTVPAGVNSCSATNGPN